MAKQTKANKVRLSFRKTYGEHHRKAYQQMMEKCIYGVEETGIEVKKIYFSKSSDSVYVTYGLDSYNTERLGLDKYNYLGQFVISSHKRYYNTQTKTFLTVQADDLADLQNNIKCYMESMLADKFNIHSYFTILSNKELEVLRLMSKVVETKAHFEVNPDQIMAEGTLDLFAIASNRRPLFVIDDEVSSNIIRTLHVKGCFSAFAQGCSNRVFLTITDLADQFLIEYGEIPNETIQLAFDNRHTFDLWKAPNPQAVKVASPVIQQATDTDLLELGIDRKWYSAFNTLLNIVQAQEGDLAQRTLRQQWVDMVSDFLDIHLPEDRELIIGHYVNKQNCGAFCIAHESDNPNLLNFHMTVLSPREPIQGYSAVTVDILPLGALDTLRALKQSCVTPTATNGIGAYVLRQYLIIRNIERHNLALGVSENKEVILVYTEKGLTQVVPTKDKTVRCAFSLIKDLDCFNWLSVTPMDNGAKRFFTTPTSNAVFEYAMAVMQFAVDNIRNTEKIIPLITNRNTMDITFYSVDELCNV